MCSVTIGEYFVICELLRNRYEVTTPPNPQNRDWDILIIKTPSGHKKDIKIQVKAVTWPTKLKLKTTKPTITGNFNGDFDYLVIVVIGFYRIQKYAVYVIPKSDLKQAIGNEKGCLPLSLQGGIKFKNNSIPFSTFKNETKRKVLNRKYRNNWKQL